MKITESLKGSVEEEILTSLEKIYDEIEEKQCAWKNCGGPRCIEGCGSCCHNFEPHILESEALYLAAWLIENQSERAEKLINGTYLPPSGKFEKTCIFFDESTPYHCTVYNGRCLICRLFGYSGDYDKNGKIRFTACKFYPDEKLKEQKLEHRQYSEEELKEIFGTLPPAMIDCMEQALSLMPETSSETKPIREAVPEAVKKLKWLLSMHTMSE